MLMVKNNRDPACRDLWQDAHGQVAAIAAIAIIPIVAVIALALDTRNVTNTKAEMQAAADAATLAAVIELRDGGTALDAQTVAIDMMAAKVAMHTDGLKCTYRTLTFSTALDEVEATWSCSEPTLISNVVNRETLNFTVAATAGYSDGSDGCVIALGESSANGIYITGSSTVKLDACSVISNSTQLNSINIGGTGSLSTACAYSSGEILSADSITTTECSSPLEYETAVADPYSDISVPDNVSSMPCVTPVKLSTSQYYMPSGRYCSNVDMKNNVTLETGGKFIFDGADLNLKSTNSSISGEQVTMIFMNDGEFSNANGGEVNLSAKTTGDYAGVLMYGDRDTSSTYNSIKIAGNISAVFKGALYFPNNDLEFYGGSSLSSGCTQIVAKQITFSGNSNIHSNCTGTGVRDFGQAGEVYLIE